MKRYIKKLLRESLIREDDDIKQKLISLIKTGDEDKIELAYAIGEGQGINMDEFVKSEYGDLLDMVSGNTIKDKLIHITNLDQLYLANKGLTSLPENIGNLTKLKALYLGGNKLETLPESIGKLKNLYFLSLGINKLKSLPESIRNLTNLNSLELGENQLTTLPDWIGKLTNLQVLTLSENQLTTLPKSIGNLTNLNELWLNDNPISDEEKKRINKILPNTEIYYMDLTDEEWLEYQDRLEREYWLEQED